MKWYMLNIHHTPVDVIKLYFFSWGLLYSMLDFLKKREVQIAIVVVILIAIIVLSVKKEGFQDFSGIWGDLAAFPAAFTESLKDSIAPKTPEPSNASEPVGSMPSVQIEAQKVVAPISIGNGLAIQAQVEIPAQSVDVPSQVPTVPPAQLEESETKVEAQQITIPAQTGVIPGKVDEKTGAIVGIPVQIPEQVIDVQAQSAHVQVMEGFRV